MTTLAELKSQLNSALTQLDAASGNLRQAQDAYGEAIGQSQQINRRTEKLRRFVGRADLLTEAEASGDSLAIQAIFNGPEVISTMIREASRIKAEAAQLVQTRQSQVNLAQYNVTRITNQINALEVETGQKGLLQTIKDAIKIS